MPARILSIPFALWAAFALYRTLTGHDAFAVYIIPPVVALAAIYVLSPQVNWWWYKRFPPDLPAGIRIMLEKYCEPYLRLSEPQQLAFRQKTALFQMAKDFKAQASDTVPEDVKAVVAASGVLLTLHQEDFLMDKFQTVVVYPTAFPSPQYPEFFHASEIFEEDGVLLFSAQHLMTGFLEPQRYYNVGLHEWARVFRLSYPDYPWPEITEEVWPKLEQISGYSRDAIFKWINRPDLEPFAATVVHFVHFPERFREVLPELAEAFNGIFYKE